MRCRWFGAHTEIALVKWFAKPEYPDGDPLLVRIDMRSPPAQTPNFLYLVEIDPARILHEIARPFVYMMRVEGVDVSPVFEI